MFSKKICGYDRKYTKEKRILYIEILIFSETKGFVFFLYRRYCFRKNKPTSKQYSQQRFWKSHCLWKKLSKLAKFINKCKDIDDHPCY